MRGTHLEITFVTSRQVVMSDEQAAHYCAVLRPKPVVPVHYAFTAGPMRDRLFLKDDGTPERFQSAAARHAPATRVRVLAPATRVRAPGEPLVLDS